ncbi:SH3 domain-containing protein [Bradyrhizobium sp. 170]|uniref:SH3 domain-containing protein n=1 Tax=Bradyrhizobium sp. 170 TaxID=2782641 RepID=UPI001FFEC878|nr:SH3 domain-containing protein [Bradyrhizobium sp. 170]UPK00535.1 SH3 domain-containing protein [Bradyrhizobium sp. 170]
MKLRGLFIAAALLLMPTAALAAPGIVTTTVSLKAGPGEGFPTVDRIPGGARVNIHGCFRGKAWCDVSWSDDRGWVSSRYLQYLYRNRYVYLPDYVDEIDVPIVPFVLTSYWSSYYAGRPWYHRRAHWGGYWQSHERFATRLTIDRSAARIGRAAAARDAALPEGRARVGVEERSRARVEERTRAGATERTRAGVTERVTREKDIATRSAREGRERAAVQPRMTRENVRTTRESARENTRATVRERAAVREQPTARARTQTPPVVARGHDEPRAAAPRIERATPRMTQPDAARGGGGPPTSARAQQTPAPAAPRAAAPATPQGGAPQAAPRGGGGPGGGGGGPGQDRR